MMFDIHVEPAKFSATKRGKVTGPVSIQMYDRFFPAEDWDDFPVVILSWWLEALLSIEGGQRGKVLCQFMDGPYWFEIDRVKGNKVDMRFFSDRVQRRENVFNAVFEFDTVATATMSAASKTIEVCQQHGWASSDLDALINFQAQANLRWR